QELLPLQLERDGHDGSHRPAGGARPRLAVMGHGRDLRVLEDRRIEPRRRLGVVVEPEAGRDPLHGFRLRYAPGHLTGVRSAFAEYTMNLNGLRPWCRTRSRSRACRRTSVRPRLAG